MQLGSNDIALHLLLFDVQKDYVINNALFQPSIQRHWHKPFDSIMAQQSTAGNQWWRCKLIPRGI